MERSKDIMTVSEPVSKSYIAEARYDIGTKGECSHPQVGFIERSIQGLSKNNLAISHLIFRMNSHNGKWLVTQHFFV